MIRERSIECGAMLADPSNIVEDDPAWFVEDYDAGRSLLKFVRTSREALSRQVFLDHRWDRARFDRLEVSLEALGGRQSPVPSAPGPNFIWHTSYCCSTLIAEVLDKPGLNLSLREPMALASLADAKRTAQLGRQRLPERAAELVMRHLGRPRSRAEKVLLKPSNFANNLIAEAGRISDGRALFLFSSLEGFLVSIAKGGDRLGKYVRRLFGNLACDVGEALPWSARDILQMSDLEIAALCWQMQIAQFERSSAALGPGRWAALNCEDFLNRPAETIAALASFFEIALTEDDVRAIVHGPVMSRHAKQPLHPFDAGSRRSQNDQIRQRLGADLPRLVDWSLRALGRNSDHPVLPERRLVSGAH